MSENKKETRAILVNLSPEMCQRFHAIAKARESNATAYARKLVEEFVNANWNATTHNVYLAQSQQRSRDVSDRGKPLFAKVSAGTLAKMARKTAAATPLAPADSDVTPKVTQITPPTTDKKVVVVTKAAPRQDPSV